MTEQPSATPGLPSPGQPQHVLHLEALREAPPSSQGDPVAHEVVLSPHPISVLPHEEQALQIDHASSTLAFAPDNAGVCCRATRSSFPLSHQVQDGETTVELSKGVENMIGNINDKHFRGGAWKDDWVVSLIHLRGSMDEEFLKPQKPGIDMWSRVSSQLAEAHEDFDKNSESCRKKWQRIYKSFKDDKALLAAPGNGNEKYLTCKWFDLVEHYMHNHVDRNGNAFGMDDQLPLLPAPVGMVADPHFANAVGTESSDQYRPNAKRARKDQKVKESLSQMVETWRESLEVLRDSEVKRVEILQTLSNTMAGLLDVLRK